tara:strand:+ start:388 stop:576 length:189 start_codon:yes stop_codon:yes gene_type:complete
MPNTDEIKKWLDEKRVAIKTDSRIIFPQFMQKFNLDRNEARMAIHRWDAERRGIPNRKSRKL